MNSKFQEIKDLWDRSSKDYDIHMQETGHYEAQKKILELLEKYITSLILDLAAGPGYLSGLLLEKGFSVTVNDFSKEMIDMCKEKFKHFENVNFSNEDASLITPNNKFNTIICCNLFYYLQNRELAIKNWSQYLEKNGVIILIEEYPFQKPSTEHMSEYESELMELIDPLSPQEIRNYFSQYNLIKEVQVSIDQKHDLYGFVFTKRIPKLKYAPLAPEVWDALGDLKRTGWVNRGVKNPESVQEHIISLLEIAKSLENVLSLEEKDGLLDMLEVHDWPEAIHGDQVIFTYDEKEFALLKADKFEKEKAALASICENLGDKGQEIMDLYLRFETSTDPAASFGRQLDKYQAVEKALEYERSQNIPLFKEFLEYARPKITHPILLRKIHELEEEFAAVAFK